MRTSNETKMVICAYKDKDFRQELKKQFTLPVNPETFTQNYKIEYNQETAHGNEKKGPEFKSTKPEELKFDFILDGTNAIEGYHEASKSKTVHEQFTAFKEVVYDLNGDIHRPNFLKIFWGDLKFQGILSGLDVNYTLFDRQGSPLRAKLTVTFLDFVAQKERVARENKKSPDITHTKLMKEGDRLDLMTYNIYNDSKYVLQIAKANGLTSFRKPRVGKAYIFPPFDKTEV